MDVLNNSTPAKNKAEFVVQSAPQVAPISAPVEWGNFGASIGLCILALNKLWGLFTQQQNSEAQMMVEFMRAADKREERMMRLIEVFLQQKS